MKKKQRKRWLALLAAAMLLLPQGVCAGEIDAGENGGNSKAAEQPDAVRQIETADVEKGEIRQRDADSVSAQSLQNETRLWNLAETTIKEALLKGESQVVLDGISTGLSGQIASLIYYSPYFSNGIQIEFYMITSSAGSYLEARISNPMSVTETEEYFDAVDRKVASILSQADGLTADADKALAIHDYLVSHFHYDVDNYTAGKIPADSYRSGGLFMNGTGVCQAYAYGYQYLLDKLDIECYVTSSEVMNHAWNIVNIDGAYYHVDCTSDDPLVDQVGRAYHDFFLLSDETIRKMEMGNGYYTGWDLQDLACTSKAYEDAYWSGAVSPVVQTGGKAYYIKEDEGSMGSGIYARDSQTGAERKIKDLGRWSASGNSFYVGAFSGLSLYNGKLYYNTSKELRSIFPDGTGDVVVYQPDTQYGNVFGSRITDGALQYVLKWKPEEASDVQTAPVSLDPGNPKYTLTTLDGKTVTTSAEGKPKVLIFIKPTCYNCQTVMGTFQDKGLSMDGVDVYVCDIQSDTPEAAEPFFDEYGREGMTYCYKANSVMWNYLSQVGITGSVTTPVIMFISQDDRIAHYSTGMNGHVAGDIYTYLDVDIRDKTSIALGQSALALTEGETAQLSWTITPDTYDGAVTFRSSNEKVATVDSKGNVTAVAEGTADIYAGIENGKEALCKVTVKKKEVPIQGVALDQQELTLTEERAIS